jgi:hypothetical protein
MRHVKKIRKTDAGQIKEQDVSLTPPLVSRIFLDVSSILLFFTNSDVKMRHLKKICKTDAGQIKEEDVPLT